MCDGAVSVTVRLSIKSFGSRHLRWVNHLCRQPHATRSINMKVRKINRSLYVNGREFTTVNSPERNLRRKWNYSDLVLVY